MGTPLQRNREEERHMDQMATLDKHLGLIAESVQIVARICGDMQQTQMYEHLYQAPRTLPYVPARLLR